MRIILFFLILVFSAPAISSSELFYVMGISKETEKELILDQLYFNESPAPVSGDDVFGSNKDIGVFFSKAIDLFSDTPPSFCEKRNCEVRSISLLDDGFRLYLPWLNSDGEVFLKDEKININRKSPSVLYSSDRYFLSGLLGPEAISIYRLSNFFGLATVSNLAKNDIAPFQDCPDLLGTPYSCDRVVNGGFSTTGNVMYGYLNHCISCSESDKAILKMVITHHLFRSKSDRDVDRAIDMFSKNEQMFKDVGINFDSLKELYLRSLAKK